MSRKLGLIHKKIRFAIYASNIVCVQFLMKIRVVATFQIITETFIKECHLEINFSWLNNQDVVQDVLFLSKIIAKSLKKIKIYYLKHNEVITVTFCYLYFLGSIFWIQLLSLRSVIFTVLDEIFCTPALQEDLR